MFQNAEEAARALEYAASQEQARWIATMNTVVISIFRQVDQMKAVLGNHHGVLQKTVGDLRALMSGAPETQSLQPVQQQPVQQPVDSGGVRVGADGTPITDQAQLEAEALMDAAAGPAPGAQPQPQAAPPAARPGRRRAPQGRGPTGLVPTSGQPLPPRVGADGNPITDQAQLEAEALMDAATEG